MKTKKIEYANAQKQECSSPFLQLSLCRYTLAFLCQRFPLIMIIYLIISIIQIKYDYYDMLKIFFVFGTFLLPYIQDLRLIILPKPNFYVQL